MEGIYALTDDGQVVNTIVYDPDNADGLTLPDAVEITSMEPRPGIGWSYDGSRFSEPT